MGKPDTIPFRGKVVAAATDTQIFVAPWRERRRYILKKLTITDASAAASLVTFFDDDSNDSSNTAPQRGNNSTDPVYAVNVAASTTVTLTGDQLPFTFFQGGMVARIPVNASVDTTTPVYIFGEVVED